jgi:hypothetical protein
MLFRNVGMILYLSHLLFLAFRTSLLKDRISCHPLRCNLSGQETCLILCWSFVFLPQQSLIDHCALLQYIIRTLKVSPLYLSPQILLTLALHLVLPNLLGLYEVSICGISGVGIMLTSFGCMLR